jgi:hypothetical protein
LEERLVSKELNYVLNLQILNLKKKEMELAKPLVNQFNKNNSTSEISSEFCDVFNSFTLLIISFS